MQVLFFAFFPFEVKIWLIFFACDLGRSLPRKDGYAMMTVIWVDEKSDITYYPTFFREELRNPSSSVKHIVTDNRK